MPVTPKLPPILAFPPTPRPPVTTTPPVVALVDWVVVVKPTSSLKVPIPITIFAIFNAVSAAVQERTPDAFVVKTSPAEGTDGKV